MKAIGYVAGILTMLLTMKSLGVIPAMILGAVVGGIGGLLSARSDVKDIESRIGSQRKISADQAVNPHAERC